MNPTRNRPINLWMLLGDLLVVALFVFVGQRDHDMAISGSWSSLFATTQALAIPWAVVAAAMGALRLPQHGRWRDWFGRIIAAWLIAVPFGLIARAFARGQQTIAVPFMLVVLGLGLLFILLWRAAVYWWLGRRASAAPRPVDE